MGIRGPFTVDQMPRSWAVETRAVRPGRFPNVGRTSGWEQIGHFKQMIRPGSIRVSCALRSSVRFDYSCVITRLWEISWASRYRNEA